MTHSTKSHPKSSSNDPDYPLGRRRTSKAAEPLSDKERAAIDGYYHNEAEELTGSVSAEELLARLSRK